MGEGCLRRRSAVFFYWWKGQRNEPDLTYLSRRIGTWKMCALALASRFYLVATEVNRAVKLPCFAMERGANMALLALASSLQSLVSTMQSRIS
jgi:hypothetical protein